MNGATSEEGARKVKPGGRRAKTSAAPEEGDNETERLPLEKAVLFLLEECRMVLPGIQALFGFQLIAVLNPSFSEKLDAGQQLLHLVSLGLVAIAIALIMTPAAYHRQTTPREVSQKFIDLATRLVLWSMGPLAVAICLEFYLVSFLILRTQWASCIAAGLLVVFVTLWWVLPRSRKMLLLIGWP
jgi:uncharacterized protein DUF6328